MAVLVTSGAGFIGGHLAEQFCADGHDVTVCDPRMRPNMAISNFVSRLTSLR